MSVRFEKIVSVKEGKVFAYEVLFSMPELGVSNEVFFKSADCEVDFQVLKRNVEAIKKANFFPSRFFLNVKPSTLARKTEQVLELISDLPVVLELTEDFATDEELRQIASARARYSFLLSLDDFGQKSSNLDRLYLLKPDFVKLDVRAVKNFPSESLVLLVEAIKRSCDAQIIAECVESEQELKSVVGAGIDLAQGFFFEKHEANTG